MSLRLLVGFGRLNPVGIYKQLLGCEITDVPGLVGKLM